MAIDKSALLRPRIGEVTHEIEGVGEVVIRPLTRGQAMQVNEAEPGEERDNLIISLGLVDPAMTPAEVQAWAEVAPAGELARLGQRVAVLSGMLEGQPKEVTKSASRRRR